MWRVDTAPLETKEITVPDPSVANSAQGFLRPVAPGIAAARRLVFPSICH